MRRFAAPLTIAIVVASCVCSATTASGLTQKDYERRLAVMEKRISELEAMQKGRSQRDLGTEVFDIIRTRRIVLVGPDGTDIGGFVQNQNGMMMYLGKSDGNPYIVAMPESGMHIYSATDSVSGIRIYRENKVATVLTVSDNGGAIGVANNYEKAVAGIGVGEDGDGIVEVTEVTGKRANRLRPRP